MDHKHSLRPTVDASASEFLYPGFHASAAPAGAAGFHSRDEKYFPVRASTATAASTDSYDQKKFPIPATAASNTNAATAATAVPKQQTPTVDTRQRVRVLACIDRSVSIVVRSPHFLVDYLLTDDCFDFQLKKIHNHLVLIRLVYLPSHCTVNEFLELHKLHVFDVVFFSDELTTEPCEYNLAKKTGGAVVRGVGTPITPSDICMIIPFTMFHPLKAYHTYDLQFKVRGELSSLNYILSRVPRYYVDVPDVEIEIKTVVPSSSIVKKNELESAVRSLSMVRIHSHDENEESDNVQILGKKMDEFMWYKKLKVLYNSNPTLPVVKLLINKTEQMIPLSFFFSDGEFKMTGKKVSDIVDLFRETSLDVNNALTRHKFDKLPIDAVLEMTPEKVKEMKAKANEQATTKIPAGAEVYVKRQGRESERTLLALMTDPVHAVLGPDTILYIQAFEAGKILFNFFASMLEDEKKRKEQKSNQSAETKPVVKEQSTKRRYRQKQKPTPFPNLDTFS